MNINSAFPSAYLKQSDLGGKRVMVTIDRVEVEEVGQGADKETKPILYFQGHDKGLVLNKTNAFEVTAIAGSDDTDNWTGVKVVLYVDPGVMYGGKKVGGVRIAAPPQAKRPAPKPEPVSEPELTEEFQVQDEDEDVPF